MNLKLVGQIDGAFIKAAVYFNDKVVSIDGPLWFTLDQWQELRELQIEDSPIWATTPEEHEATTGEAIEA